MTVFFFLAAFLSEILPSSNTYYVDFFEGSELTRSYRIHSDEEGLWEYREIFQDGSEEFAFIVEQSDYVGHIYTIIQVKGDTQAHSFNLSEVLDESLPVSEKQSQQISLSDASIFLDLTQEVTENQNSSSETDEAEETEEYTIHMNSKRGIIYLGIPDAGILLVTRPLVSLE
jgi:hypothetical protein